MVKVKIRARIWVRLYKLIENEYGSQRKVLTKIDKHDCACVFKLPAATRQVMATSTELCVDANICQCVQCQVCVCVFVSESVSLLPQEALQHTLNEVPWKG